MNLFTQSISISGNTDSVESMGFAPILALELALLLILEWVLYPFTALALPLTLCLNGPTKNQ